MDDLHFIIEIRKSFLIETIDLLNDSEHLFLKLEKDPNDKNALESIFRLVHNLKGSGYSVGINELAQLAHQLENLLSKIRLGKMEANSEIVDLLLECNDRFKKNVESLSSDLNVSINNCDLITKISKFTENNHTTIAPQSPIWENEDNHGNHNNNDNQNNNSNAYDDLGTILIKQNVVTPEQVEKAASLQHKKIGEILIEQGSIKHDDLKKALDLQQTQRGETNSKEMEFMRIPLSKIDSLLNCFGEQVILQSALESCKYNLESKEYLNKIITQLSKITYDLQQTAISLRMVPIKILFSKMERIVRDTSRTLGKTIQFVSKGDDNEIDKNIIDELSAPLMHMVRNAVDHGIESATERINVGKKEIGTIILSASNKGGSLHIKIEDDGQGLNKDKIQAKAISQGLIGKEQVLTEKQIFDLIFINGFSTREQVSDVSGRGVGMDVVKQAIIKLKGGCEISSRQGKGTCFSIRLPLTLAVFNGMIVQIQQSRYIVPNSDIEEIVSFDLKNVRAINKQERVVNVAGNVIPLIDLREFFSKNKSSPDKGGSLVLIVRVENMLYALIVDKIISQQRIVHKNLGLELEGLVGVVGGTILSDGNVALILELTSIINSVSNKTAALVASKDQIQN
ncbi:MAG: chemotaxis protein CheA [Oligoflexia bacterium]|nr:chemotaxis protein CheA [Oligoflexia bacterium]